LGGVAHKPWRARIAETALANRASGLDAPDLELAPAKGHGHNDFKIDLARRLIAAGPLEESRG
jgi:xanthine dehydrogenase YagS FAD-binding subunit